MSSPLEDEEELPFEMVSDTELSRSDRLARMYEEYVYIPVRVILEDWRSLVGLSILLRYVGTEPGPTAPGPVRKPELSARDGFDRTESAQGSRSRDSGDVENDLRGCSIFDGNGDSRRNTERVQER